GVERLTPHLDEDTDTVDDNAGTGNGAGGRRLIANIRLHRLDLTDDPVGTHEERLIRPAHRNTHPPTGLGQPVGDIAADEAGSAEHGGDGSKTRHRGAS